MTLSEIQIYLKKHKVDAYFLPRNNMFLEEDILEEENEIFSLTGFSGSAASLIICQDKTYLFTDGRYELQSKMETNPQEVEIICSSADFPYLWLQNHFESGKFSLMYNPWTISAGTISKFTDMFPKAKLICDEKNILENKLSSKKAHVFSLSEEYAGITAEEKIAKILPILKQNDIDAYLLTSANEVSWLTNLRSDALPDSPILRAFALIKKDGSVTLFADNTDKADILPMSKLEKSLKAVKKGKLGVDKKNMPQMICEIFGAKNLRDIGDIIRDKQILKNEIELEGYIKAHRQDAVAMIKFLYWLDNNYKGKTELDIVAKIDSLRAEQDLFISKSFDTIAATGSNGAIVHYHPSENTNKVLERNSVLLLDSGGHYQDGTTDITRTIALGIPKQKIVDANTIVLKSHIALASSIFPKGTTGVALDALCRKELWKESMDFKHGTGHGVGFVLNVHEAPRISPQAKNSHFYKNMVTSIEPGYYKENDYGIRIENLYYTQECANSDMLKFEVLTLVPLDKRLINKYLLSEDEIKWVDEYHQKVLEIMSPYLDAKHKEWLEDACAPL